MILRATLSAGDMPKLRNLTILTNAYTESVPTPVDYKVWKKCRKSNKRLRVHMVTEGKHSKELTFQARAPTKSIVYNTPYTQVAVNVVFDPPGPVRMLVIISFTHAVRPYASLRLLHKTKSTRQRQVAPKTKLKQAKTLRLGPGGSLNSLVLCLCFTENTCFHEILFRPLLFQSTWLWSSTGQIWNAMLTKVCLVSTCLDHLQIGRTRPICIL